MFNNGLEVRTHFYSNCERIFNNNLNNNYEYLKSNLKLKYFNLKSDKLKLIIFYNAKCGCTSLKNFVYNIEENTTYKGNNIHNHIGHFNQNKYFVTIENIYEKYPNYKKILVFRNPLERIISFYKNKILISKEDNHIDIDSLIMIDNNISFGKFIKLLEIVKPNKFQHHLIPQTTYINKDWIDEIIDLRDLNSFLSKYSDINYCLNKTSKDINLEISEETIKIIKDIYKEDYDFKLS